MKWVNVKEARLIDQWLHSSIASATWRDLINFFGQDMPTIAKAVAELDKSELYKTVGWDIEKKAEEIVETKCKPEWDKISEEMKPLGERRNELAKKKASTEVGSAWGDKINIEAVAAAKPDLILVNNRQEKIYDQLSKIAPVVMVEMKQVDWKEDFMHVAKVFGKEEAATAWINDYNNEVNNQSTGDCNSLLGSPTDTTSVAWLLFTVLNWLRVLGPLAVIVLSGIEFAQAIVKSDDDTMKKAKGHLTTRLVMAGLLFLIPSVVKLLLDVFNLTSDPMCGIGG